MPWDWKRVGKNQHAEKAMNMTVTVKKAILLVFQTKYLKRLLDQRYVNIAISWSYFVTAGLFMNHNLPGAGLRLFSSLFWIPSTPVFSPCLWAAGYASGTAEDPSAKKLPGIDGGRWPVRHFTRAPPLIQSSVLSSLCHIPDCSAGASG